jgi:hypothetical protein
MFDNGTIIDSSIHTCPNANMDAPYFFGAACHDLLILWHDIEQQLNIRQRFDHYNIRHHFESTRPIVAVLFDPFHRYYSLYNDSMIEIKDLNGNVLAQFFTDIQQATNFDFIDHQGTLLVANQTHMQLFISTNKQMWLDV